MIALKIGNSLEIPKDLIQAFRGNLQEVVVITLIGKSLKQVEKGMNSLLKVKVTLATQCLFYCIQDNFVIFGAVLDGSQHSSIILQLIFNISAFQYYVTETEQELDDVLKLYLKVPPLTWKKLQKWSPKVNEQQARQSIFRVTKKFMMLKGKPKLIEEYRMNGRMLVNMMLNFCDFYNTNKSCIDENAFATAYKGELANRLEQIQAEYQDGICKLKIQSQSEKILLESEQLDIQHRELLRGVVLKLIKQSPYEHQPKEQLLQRILEEYEVLTAQNQEESREYCSKLMTSFWNILQDESKKADEIVSQKDVYIKKMQAQYEETFDAYQKDAVGPYKYRTVAEYVPQLLFQMFDFWFETLISHYTTELNRNKAQLLQVQDNSQELQNRLDDLESKKFELENQNQSLYFDLEAQKRDVEKLTKLKELQEELNARQQEEWRIKMEKNKNKKKQYKERCEKASEDLRKCQLDLAEKKRDLVNNLTKINLLESALQQSLDRGDNVTKLQKDLISLMTQFRENLIQAESQFQRPSNVSDNSRLSSGYQLVQLDRLQKKYDKLKEERKVQEQKQIDLTRTLDDLQNQLSTKESQILELKRDLDSLKKSAEQTELIEVNKQNEEFMKVLLSHKQKVEEEYEKNQNLQNQYYEKTMKLSEAVYQRDNLMTILREGLKMARGKQNTVQNILRTMPPDRVQEIKDIFVQAGLNL